MGLPLRLDVYVEESDTERRRSVKKGWAASACGHVRRSSMAAKRLRLLSCLVEFFGLTRRLQPR